MVCASPQISPFIRQWSISRPSCFCAAGITTGSSRTAAACALPRGSAFTIRRSSRSRSSTRYRAMLQTGRLQGHIQTGKKKEIAMDDKTRTELEAATFRRLVEHLRERTDVQNIDLMNLAGFSRNCLSKWYRAEAEDRGLALTDPESREIVYGMPYDEWRAKHQKEASGEQKAAFAAFQQH